MNQHNTHKTWQQYLPFLLMHLIFPISAQLSASFIYDQISHEPPDEICTDDHSHDQGSDHFPPDFEDHHLD
ncbi:hypothetical protein [Coleofasciculus sp.]